MIHFRKILAYVPVFAGLLVCSGWGSGGHRKINEHAPASFPASMAFLKASWTILLAEHGSDADKRKSWDPDEGPKHYIDIDDYPEFVLNGKIPQTYDSVCALHGEPFVIDKGTLPWATLVTFDSLRNCFARMDWEKAGLFAADLGHYVADAHQPLHLTRNYDGQYTNQGGIHSRYETKMIGKYIGQVQYPDDSVQYVSDISGHVFNYIYLNYVYVDSLLLADSVAHAVSGSITSDQYYSLLWDATKGFTTQMFKSASLSLAALIYTAWVEAGSPYMNPYAIGELTGADPVFIVNQPNPFSSETWIRFFVRDAASPVMVKVYDITGNNVVVLQDGFLNAGMNKIRWDAGGFRPGVYYISFTAGSDTRTIKAILFN